MALTLKSTDLPELLDIDQKTATRLFDVGKAFLAEALQGSRVPDAIENEALLRVAGYMANMPSPGVTSKKVDDFGIRYDSRNTSVMERSGAAALVGRFLQRRTGQIIQKD